MHATTASTSASSSTTTGALPPSSRCTRARCADAAAAIALPVRTEPVSDTIRTAGWVTIASPTGLPRPHDDVEDAGRQHLERELGQPQRRQRRELGWLQHDRVARRQRRRDLPDRHRQRVVPRRDLADDAHRLATNHRRVALDVLAGGAALEHPRRAGEEAQVIRAQRDLLGGRPQWLADVGGLDPGELVGVLVQQVGELEQRRGARDRASPTPSAGPAARAASTAARTSSTVALGISASTSSLAGLSTGSLSVPRPSTSSPPITSCIAIAHSSGQVLSNQVSA